MGGDERAVLHKVPDREDEEDHRRQEEAGHQLDQLRGVPECPEPPSIGEPHDGCRQMQSGVVRAQGNRQSGHSREDLRCLAFERNPGPDAKSRFSLPDEALALDRLARLHRPNQRPPRVKFGAELRLFVDWR
nr:J451 [uncultured bacterium]